MKKKIKSLRLNKSVISSFSSNAIVGGATDNCDMPGTGQSVDMTCTGMQTCGNCTVGGSGTLAECDPNNDNHASRRRCQ